MNGSVLDRLARPVPIDDRLRARRIKVRRDEGRRRLRRLIIAVVISLIVVLAWGITRSPLLDVDHISVVGAEHTSENAAVVASGIAKGNRLLDLDLSAAEAGLVELPWVAEATVSRSWKGTIELSLIEREPVAVVRDGEETDWLVDGDGWVLGPRSSEPGSYLVVVGLNPPATGSRFDPMPGDLLALVALVPSSVQQATELVEVDEAGDVWFQLYPRPDETDAFGEPRIDGGRVRFGDARASQDELLAAATVLNQVDLTDLEVLDVRVPSNPVITRINSQVSSGTISGDAE